MKLINPKGYKEGVEVEGELGGQREQKRVYNKDLDKELVRQSVISYKSNVVKKILFVNY